MANRIVWIPGGWKRPFIASLCATLASCTTPANGQDAAQPLESRYTLLDNCVVVAAGIEPIDHVRQRCDGWGGIPVWLQYTDAARLGVGFGYPANTFGMFSIERHPSWPVEWRGPVQDGVFQPIAAIIRMNDYATAPGEPDRASLLVFRLTGDGMSCPLSFDAGDNEEARRIADASLREYRCLSRSP
ncbi:hypothetical protein [Aurantiacibacter gangjinensis]|nr:hypothetical protein [Aurantiacibacter gangjinensis]